ncbi:serine/threonine-protein phosphatase 7 long form-like protein [Iris pallida]|uniref:Serine/threonine-protein phosphatase 7 long form-like protein n=1 Tax=Iris pallida TaxID=29817 RepID=A0AAX6DYN5_IRIPA|nr:serine/threonine-protein phosphatase 7 long form-like protein [Iris pallida]
MNAGNDGRIPGGPTTEREEQERKNHISRLVFTGELYDYKPDVRLRERGQWRNATNYATWQINTYQKGLVNAFGFGYVDEFRFLLHDRDLIFSLVERWWPQRNTFQLPVGEMTVTLLDVANILGLPIAGEPIFFDNQPSAATTIRRYLGIDPPEDTNVRSDVTINWLRENFMDLDRTIDGPVNVDEERIVCCTRAYLLALCGSVLFPNATGCRITVRLLPFLENLVHPTRYAWGAAVLAYLYASLTEFVTASSLQNMSKNLTGCMSLLQIWAYEHFAIGRPVTSISREIGVFPVGRRWTTDVVDQAHCGHPVVSIYRTEFDSLTHDEVTWMPYIIRADAPDIQRMSYPNSHYNVVILYDFRTMYHPADRVLRQFGLVQTIPNAPEYISHNKSGRLARIQRYLHEWNTRSDRYNILNMSRPVQSHEDWLGDISYRRWYGAPRIGNRAYTFEEIRFTNRAVDDCSMRRFIDNICQLRPEMVQAIIDRDYASTFNLVQRILEGMERDLKYGPAPHMPPVYIPPDYPTGNVSQRQSRKSSYHPGEEAPYHPPEETFYHSADEAPYGEGTSYQPTGEGTSGYAGEGTSGYAGEGIFFFFFFLLTKISYYL